MCPVSNLILGLLYHLHITRPLLRAYSSSFQKRLAYTLKEINVYADLWTQTIVWQWPGGGWVQGVGGQ